jgi:hypothetical protein
MNGHSRCQGVLYDLYLRCAKMTCRSVDAYDLSSRRMFEQQRERRTRSAPSIEDLRTDGLENRLLRPLRAIGESHARVKRRQRLGGVLSYHYREAA